MYIKILREVKAMKINGYEREEEISLVEGPNSKQKKDKNQKHIILCLCVTILYVVVWIVSHSYTQYRCKTGRQQARIYENSSVQDLQDSEYVWTIKESFITETTKTLLHKFYCLPGAIRGSSVTTLRTLISQFILSPSFLSASSVDLTCTPFDGM